MRRDPGEPGRGRGPRAIPRILAHGHSIRFAGQLSLRHRPRRGRLLIQRPARRRTGGPMSGIPSAQSKEPGSPDPAAQGNPRPLPSAGKRPTWKRILAPLVLGVLGLVVLLWAVLLLPSIPPEYPVPPYTQLQVYSTFPISVIEYTVSQVSPAVAEMTIMVGLYPGQAHPPADTKPAQLDVNPPNGIPFRNCPASVCQAGPPDGFATWTEPLAFTSYYNSIKTATAHLFVKASNFGVTSNGLVASAAIPDVTYGGPAGPSGSEIPQFLAWYHLPSATSYDWSSYPTVKTGTSYAAWQEQLINGDTAGRAAVGINHVGQANDDTKTLIAGILFGLAGGAILSAVQELLHATLEGDTSQ